ncbi:SAM-dependent methyltransferase [Nocardioides sp. BE266]|uniref:class I SAM-dependent methyltransferase n=1 Tax=Nocardioides sp. BE266 TaxID=2817725 RepID=UPI0028637DB3|nr:methyltransferase domain-containing protein [Nocardioides sp. BE266]MDR7253129.1 SAM-dependent methyltransferase [Nocardioides sp. BE266]
MRAISDQHRHLHAHHSPEAWDERYGDQAMWSGHPNEALVREVADMTPRTALDVGCGEGADAIWLALRGWRVDALDVSGKALDRAREAAEQAGVEVRWLHHGLEDLPDESAYDLVSVFYPALLRADGSVLDVLLDAVAEGGTLLVVHHAHVDRERAREHGFDPDDYVRHEDVLAALPPTDWAVEQAGERRRTAPEGPGAHHHTDLVLRAWRKVSA